MQKAGQCGSKLAVLFLTAAIFALLLCSTGVFAQEIVNNDAPNGGCHGSLPQDRDTPAPPHLCCAAAPIAKPSLIVRHMELTFLAPGGLTAGEQTPFAFGVPSPLFSPLLSKPPGFIVLRI
jgi:hypothetical protein